MRKVGELVGDWDEELKEGDRAVFEGYDGGTGWKYTMGKEYACGYDEDGDFGFIEDNGEFCPSIDFHRFQFRYTYLAGEDTEEESPAELKVGDKVMLKESSKWANLYEGNPTGVVGEVKGTSYDDKWYCVNWIDGRSNAYEVDGDHLELVERAEKPVTGLKLLVVGKARHGKDTLCEWLRDNLGYSFQSSSERIIQEFFPALQQLKGYETVKEAYNDRYNYRDFLYHLVATYNSYDLTRMAKLVLTDNDIYCGMRKYEELEACKKAGLFDLIVWVDAEERLGDTETTSCTVKPSQADIIITNNDTEQEFLEKIERVMKLIGKEVSNAE